VFELPRLFTVPLFDPELLFTSGSSSRDFVGIGLGVGLAALLIATARADTSDDEVEIVPSPVVVPKSLVQNSLKDFFQARPLTDEETETIRQRLENQAAASKKRKEAAAVDAAAANKRPQGRPPGKKSLLLSDSGPSAPSSTGRPEKNELVAPVVYQPRLERGGF
jgi:hypothetical protein